MRSIKLRVSVRGKGSFNVDVSPQGVINVHDTLADPIRSEMRVTGTVVQPQDPTDPAERILKYDWEPLSEDPLVWLEPPILQPGIEHSHEHPG